MAVDQDYERHVETWRGFTRLVQWTLAGAIIVLVMLALITL
jgi:hypothetical protein